MNSREVCQQDFEFNLYDDLDVVIDAEIKIEGYDPDFSSSVRMADYEVTLNINSTEIKIDGDKAMEIFKAIECRVSNKINDIRNKLIASFHEEKAREYFETKRYMKEGRI